MLNVIADFFASIKWDFVKDQENSIIHTEYQSNNNSWRCYAQWRDQQQQLVFYSIAPIAVPQDRRTAVAIYETRINYGLVLGNFELDLSDGEIRYKTSIDITGSQLTPTLIKQIVMTNVTMMEKYLPSLQKVIQGVDPNDPQSNLEI
jgi:Uncharacterized conserved protein